MTEPQIRALFLEIADQPAVSRVDPQLLLRRGRARLRWRRAGLAGGSAVATAAVITASLAISGAIQRGLAGPGPASSTASIVAKVPPYLVALHGDTPGPAVVVATATGAVRGTVAPPKAYPVFTMVRGAGDGRTFIFAAAARGLTQAPVRFYRLVLSKSGHPGPLTPLPLPPETSGISGLAVSLHGSKLAVSVFPPNLSRAGAKIEVFSLATGTLREWAWPGKGWIGWTVPLGVNEFDARSLSWAADNRTLLFEEHTDAHGSRTAQARLLDTAAPAGNLLASSTLVPIPSAELAHWAKAQPPFYTTGPLLLTGDGTKIVAPTSRNITHGPAMLGSGITVFSVRTGKPIQVLDRQRLRYDAGAAVLWVNHSGTVMIAARPLPKPASPLRDSVIGVQTPARFVPLPPGVQHYSSAAQSEW